MLIDATLILQLGLRILTKPSSSLRRETTDLQQYSFTCSLDVVSVTAMINEVIKFGNPCVLFGRICDETLLQSMRRIFVDPDSMYAFCTVSSLL